MTALILAGLGALTALVAEFFVLTPAPGVRRQRTGFGQKHPAFFLLAPVIGALAGLTCLALFAFPYLAGLVLVSCLVVLVIISNTKLKVLRQVYAAQDSDNARHIILYPDFYIVHLGVMRTLLVGAALVVLMWAVTRFDSPVLLEAGTLPAFARYGLGVFAWFGAYRLILFFSARIVRETRRDALGLTGDPNKDTVRFGLFPTVLLHTLLTKDRRHLRPLSYAYARDITAPEVKPHIIALQGESYMDLARVDALVGGQTPWASLEALENDFGAATGPLAVPCWGAYTMQTEMGMLTGIPHSDYQTSGINPYLAVASRQKVWSFAHALKSEGYDTVCLHPAKRGFFRRDKVMPNLGFDRFLTLGDFADSPRFGPYVSDTALGDRMEALIRDSDKPLFLHAITIESHGPWTTGRFGDLVTENTLLANEPTKDLAFSLYRLHMDHILELARRLIALGTPERPVVLALYGDHQGAHGDLFDAIDFQDDRVDMLLARSDLRATDTGYEKGPREITSLGPELLRLAGFEVGPPRRSESL